MHSVEIYENMLKVFCMCPLLPFISIYVHLTKSEAFYSSNKTCLVCSNCRLIKVQAEFNRSKLYQIPLDQ